jgi:SWI/SNF-related matrix-associated actin-dependent regulator 1 of chromatin subfamily A
MNKIDLEKHQYGDRFIYTFPFNHAQKDFVKYDLEASFRKEDKKAYWFSLTNCTDIDKLAEYIKRFGVKLTDAARLEFEILGGELEDESSHAFDTESIELSQAEDADISNLDLRGFGIELFPFQKAGVKYAFEKKRAMIADDMGLGKTVQAAATLYAANCFKFVVVCPASVKINWQRELFKCAPRWTSSIWEGKKGGRLDVNALIINYDNLGKHRKSLERFQPQAYIFDEFHYLKNEAAKRTQVAFELAEQVEWILGLTGTPVLNRPFELVSLLKILRRFDEFETVPDEFVRTYCNAYKQVITVKTKKGFTLQKEIWNTSGAKNLQELSGRLRESCMIRRTKTQVLKDLPAKRRVQIVFDIDNRKEYDECYNSVSEYMAACAAEDKAFLDEIKHLPKNIQQIKIEERKNEVEQKAKRAEQLVMIEQLKQLAVRGMLAAATDWIRDFLDTGEKLLAFSTHNIVQYELGRAFDNQAQILAEMDGKTRQANIDRFINSDSCNFLNASLKAGGTGVDGLQRVCSNAAILELGWTPAEHLQGEDRLLRIGQDKPVTIYYFIPQNTIVETIQAMLAGKQAVSDSILDGADETKDGSIFNELVDLLSGAPDKL